VTNNEPVNVPCKILHRGFNKIATDFICKFIDMPVKSKVFPCLASQFSNTAASLVSIMRDLRFPKLPPSEAEPCRQVTGYQCFGRALFVGI
jgi:hypothetical protein